MSDAMYEDRENYKAKVFRSPNGQYKLTLYFVLKDGQWVTDDEVWEETDSVPTLDEILGDN